MFYKNKLAYLLIFLVYSNQCFSTLDKQIVQISARKCGTYLLMKCINLLTGRTGIKATEYEHLDEITLDKLEQFTNLTEDCFFRNHLVYRPEYASIMVKNRCKIILIYRDPRDQIISYIYYRKKMGHDKHLSIDKAISSLIMHSDMYYEKNIKNIKSFYDAYLPWSDIPGALTVRFEDLVGPQGGGCIQKQYECIKKINAHLEYNNNDEMLAYVANNLFGDTRTFRKGIIGDWKNHFTPAHKQAFKEVAGQLLIDLGYEKDFNW